MFFSSDFYRKYIVVILLKSGIKVCVFINVNNENDINCIFSSAIWTT